MALSGSGRPGSRNLARNVAGVFVLVTPFLVRRRRERRFSAGDGRRRSQEDRALLPVRDAAVAGDRRRHERRARRNAEALFRELDLGRGLVARAQDTVIRLGEIQSHGLRWLGMDEASRRRHDRRRRDVRRRRRSDLGRS